MSHFWTDTTWLTGTKAEPLITGIPHVDRVLVWDSFVPFQITYEHFDILVNLEKVPGIWAGADQVNAWQKFGFRFLRHEGTYMIYAGAGEVYALCMDTEMKRSNDKPWQQGKNDLHEYIDWLHSCRVIVTNDSLGLHLTQPLNRNLIGLFGPTSEKEVFFSDDDICLITQSDCPHRPCFSSRCRQGKSCMFEIYPQGVASCIFELLKKSSGREIFELKEEKETLRMANVS